jgi:hypothetical protein
VNLADAVFWCLEYALLVGLPCAVFGAAAYTARRAFGAQAHGGPINP